MIAVMQETAPGHLTVEGELTFATVTELWKDSQPRLRRATDSLIIDLSGVSRADSAALGLLVEWCRLGAGSGLSLSFIHLPPRLRTMVSAYNLDPLLPIHG